MKITSFKDLFLNLLSDIYAVELQLCVELPQMAKKAHSDHLKEGIQHHLAETKNHVKRLEKIFKLLNEEPQKVEWTYDIKNVARDLEKFLRDNTPSAITDAALISIAQRIEHFEIASYTTLIGFADASDNAEIKSLLKDSLKEAEKAVSALSKLAKGRMFTSGINTEALHTL